MLSHLSHFTEPSYTVYSIKNSGMHSEGFYFLSHVSQLNIETVTPTEVLTILMLNLNIL
jgi:hypothetical protein